MSSILEALHEHPVRQFADGETILIQGGRTGILYILIEGAVEVVKDDVTVATATKPGVIFGELSALLGVAHTATVRALRSSKFHVIPNPREFLEKNPSACFHLCETLARRLDSANKHLVDVKQKAAEKNRGGIDDAAIDALMQRRPSRLATPREAALQTSDIPA